MSGRSAEGAVVLVLPVVHRPSFGDPDWREQFDREVLALQADGPPPRTRPMMVARREGEP